MIVWSKPHLILQQETPFTSVEIKSLEEKVLEVLKQIRKEKDEEMVKVDMWCHFGHAYVTKVDEGEMLSHLFAFEKRNKLIPSRCLSD